MRYNGSEGSTGPTSPGRDSQAQEHCHETSERRFGNSARRFLTHLTRLLLGLPFDVLELLVPLVHRKFPKLLTS